MLRIPALLPSFSSAATASTSSRLIKRMSHTKSAFPEVFIVGAARTPVGSFQGQFATVPAVQLGVAAVTKALDQASVKPEDVEDIYFGSVLQGGLGQSPARQVALGAGCTISCEATTINKVCASGMKAITMAAQHIQTGQRDIMLAGGMESMSLVPNFYPRAPATFGNVTVADGIVHDGLTDVYTQVAMGVCADATAKKHDITRQDQDTYALNSYSKAASSWASQAFAKEIAPVTIKTKKGDKTFVEDEEYKKVIPEKVGSLKPVFNKDGTVTAANASNLNDGASALVLMSEGEVEKRGAKPIGKIISFADAACAPSDFPVAPALAIPLALKKAGLTVEDITAWEINEAFSAVAIVNAKILGIDQKKLNVLGGAVALGHALGSSGSRIVVTLIHLLKPGQYGVAGICNGGGGATAIVVQRV